MPSQIANLTRLGRRIRRLRQERGLSQEELARPVYTAAYISHVEHGKRKASQEALGHIADRLGMTLEQLLTGRDPDEDLRLEVETQRSIASIHAGRVDEAEAALSALVARARETGSPRALEQAEMGLGLALARQGRPEEALAAYSRAASSLADAPPTGRTTALVGQARCLFQLGEVRESIHVLETHLIELQREAQPDPSSLIEIYAALIPPYFEVGLIDKAKETAARGWAIAPEVPDPEGRACLYVNRAQLLLTQGEPRAALASLALAEDLYRHLGWYSASVKVSLGRSLVLIDEGDLDGAEQLLRTALVPSDAAISLFDRVKALTQLAVIQRRRGAPSAALGSALEAVELAGPKMPGPGAEAAREAGLCELALGNADAALNHWKTALKGFQGSGDHEEISKTARLIGDHLFEMGDTEGAASIYREALGSLAELR